MGDKSLLALWNAMVNPVQRFSRPWNDMKWFHGGRRASNEKKKQGPHPELCDIIDRTRLAELQRLGDETDPNFMENVLRTFLDETAERLEDLCRAITNADMETVKGIAHKQKGSCINIGARSMANMCELLGKQAGDNVLDGAEDILGQLEVHFNHVKSFLEKEYVTYGRVS
jgi:HPt (histidine-containing phosphotransfer) domain-containing protein